MSRGLRIAVALVGLAVTMPTREAASAPSVAGESAVLEECRERFVIAPGDEVAIRRRVPAAYELSRDAEGRPLLYVAAISCDRYRVRGTMASTTAAAFGAMIKSPDGVGCTSGWPVVGGVKGDVLSCNLYVLFAAYDNPSVVRWLRAGTPDLPVHHVTDLRFHESGLDVGSLGSRLRFHAGRPAPSPFEIDAVVRERPVETSFTATFWAETSSGTVRVRFESNDLALGEAEGTVRAAPGTEMARLLGARTATGAQPFMAIAGNRWGRGSLTKTVLPLGVGP